MLVELHVVEQREHAVMEVLGGAQVTRSPAGTGVVAKGGRCAWTGPARGWPGDWPFASAALARGRGGGALVVQLRRAIQGRRP